MPGEGSLVVIFNSLMFCTLGKLAVTAVSHCIISVLFVSHMLITQIILLIHILIICSFYLILLQVASFVFGGRSEEKNYHLATDPLKWVGLYAAQSNQLTKEVVLLCP